MKKTSPHVLVLSASPHHHKAPETRARCESSTIPKGEAFGKVVGKSKCVCSQLLQLRNEAHTLAGFGLHKFEDLWSLHCKRSTDGHHLRSKPSTDPSTIARPNTLLMDNLIQAGSNIFPSVIIVSAHAGETTFSTTWNKRAAILLLKYQIE